MAILPTRRKAQGTRSRSPKSENTACPKTSVFAEDEDGAQGEYRVELVALLGTY